MNQHKKLGLVTVLYNSPDVLSDFFISISLQEYTNFHLFIVDNSSTPESLNLCKTLSTKYSIPASFIDNKGKNLGVAAGNNQGIEQALIENCDVVTLINNDLIFLDTKVFSRIYESLNTGEKLVSPLILDYPAGMIWYAGGYFDELRGVAPHINAGNAPFSPSNYRKYYSYAPTCFLAIDKQVFDEVGLMDEDYFVYYDDTDFLYRCSSKGLYVYLNTDAVISHKVSSSTGGDLSTFGVYYLTRNRLFFIRKNLKFPYRFVSIFYTLLSRTIKALLSKRNFRNAFFRGMYDGLKGIK
ncbi:glycosyltransferase family 2 protein [Shewanella sp. SR44-3]|uniref:glycosyltransferase family 2 protein n=1 Tax=Shewanella sp. SR44-3 TaxID=2760936 RepID=UPI0015F7F4A9|nr:glycosyltransferase family 2 protein [Shewanella sp. SR44-3]MBB1269291.1 glycosyltransferase family 2 protein [Shewanella sp. SR44-3]